MECGCPDVHECRLREYAIDLEVHPERVAGAHIAKQEVVNRYYVRNMNKCILCGRCVRVCDEVARVHAIDFAKRGFESILSPQFYRDMEHSDCTFCGLCAQLCPAGALLERRVERLPHQDKMTTVKTTCPHCPLGCELVLNMDKERTRITRITTDMDAVNTPNRGLTCLRGRYHFQDVAKDRLTEPRIGAKSVAWDQGIRELSEVLSKGKIAIFLGSSLTDQEIAAVKSVVEFKEGQEGSIVAGKDFFQALPGPGALSELLASFETETPKGKVKPDVAALVQKMTLFSKAVEFKTELAETSENFKSLYGLGANVAGLLASGLPLQGAEAAIQAVKNGAVSRLLFVDCTPFDFGLAESDLKGVKKVLLISHPYKGNESDLSLPITAWAEREGATTSAFGGAKLAVHMGPLPLQGARSLRWIFAEALRKLGVEIAASEMAVR
jgi:ferredoxin